MLGSRVIFLCFKLSLKNTIFCYNQKKTSAILKTNNNDICTRFTQRGSSGNSSHLHHNSLRQDDCYHLGNHVSSRWRSLLNRSSIKKQLSWDISHVAFLNLPKVWDWWPLTISVAAPSSNCWIFSDKIRFSSSTLTSFCFKLSFRSVNKIQTH